VNNERKGIMEKARARRRRRAEIKTGKKAPAKRKAPAAAAATSLGEKVVDLAQETAAQVGALVQSAARKFTGTTRTKKRVRSS
jgi:hypothetical protein